MSQEPIVRSGYRPRARPSVEDLSLRLEISRQAEDTLRRAYYKLRLCVESYVLNRGLENEHRHFQALLREVERDVRQV